MAGRPFGWLYAASHIYDSSQPTMCSFVMVLVGIPLTMVVVAKLLGRLNRIYGEITQTTPQVRVVLPWHRSMRAERDAGYPASVLDVVMVCSVGLAVAMPGHLVLRGGGQPAAIGLTGALSR